MNTTRSQKRRTTGLVIGMGLFIVSSPLSGDVLDDIQYNELVARLGGDVPTGSGVIVGQVEASASGSYAPDQANSEFVGVNFNLRSGASGVSNHASTVARNFYGASSSVAYGISDVYVYEANGWLGADYLNYGGSSTPSAPPQGLKIFNHSWIAINTGVDAALVRRADFASHIVTVFSLSWV